MGFFKGTPATATEQNGNNGLLTGALGSTLGSAGQASGLLGGLLGGGFDAYKDKAGYDWQTKEGSKGILGNAAARGLLNSGSTGKALVNYGNEQAKSAVKDYTGQLFNLGNLGLGAGQVLAASGDKTSTEKKGKPGLGSIIGGKLLGI